MVVGSLGEVLIDDLIDNLAVRVEPFAICEVGAPGELVFPPSETVTLHFVLRSTGSFVTAGRPPVPIAPYTLVIVPAGLRHSIKTAAASSEAGDDGIVAIEGLESHHVGPPGPRDLVVACGHMRAVYAEGLDLFGMLEDPIVLDFAGVSEMESVFDLLLDESTGASPGGRAMMTALMNQCLVLVFRRLCDSPECRLPWLAALDDARLAAVVNSVLEKPAADHSLESLAAEAHMSRSSFARDFHSAFGRPPMTFVRDVRLRRGANLLVTSSRSIGEIARRVGFASRSHFSRAFRDYFGLTPSAFRAERHRGGSSASLVSSPR